MLAGLTLAIPFTVLTASPTLGRLARRVQLCGIPEEFHMPESLARVTGGPSPVTPARAA